MKTLRRFLVRLTTSVTRRRDDERFREELEDHLARRRDDYVRAGLAGDEARRRATLEIGAVEALKEDYRDRQGLPVLEQLLQDARIALRRMRQAPGFRAAAVATLALGLGLNSAIWSLAYALFLKPLPLEDASRLVFVDQTHAGRPRLGYTLSYPDYIYYREHARAFADLAAHYSTSPLHVATPAGAVNLMGSVVTANYFDVLRLTPAMGRFFSADEDRVPGRHPVAVLSHDVWRTRFGANPGILDTTVRINGTEFTVIGIAPARFSGIVHGLQPNDVWIPSAMFAVGYRYCDGFARDCKIVQLVGRLAGDVSIDEAQAEMDGLARQLESAFPATNTGRGVHVHAARGVRLQEQSQNAPVVSLLAGAAAVLLLVASANVASLLLARGLRRRREIAIRLALGASRSRLIRLLLVESIALAIAGSVAGVIVAIWSIEVLRVFFGVNTAGVALNLDLSLDWRVVLAGIVLAFVTGALTGIAPALQATRPEALSALKEETARAGARRSRFREALLVVQVAASVVLLTGSGLLVRSLLMLQRGSGFDPEALVLVRIRPSLAGYNTTRAWAFHREVLRRIEALPGVVAASPAGSPALLPGWARQATLQLPGRADDGTAPLSSGMSFVGSRYFETLGGAIVQGRGFDDRDTPGGKRVAVVNEILAHRLWPGSAPVGAALIVNDARFDVVGVVRDVRLLSMVEEPQPMVYLDFWQQDQAENWAGDSQTHVRLSGKAEAIAPEIRRVISEMDRDVPFSDVQTLATRLHSELSKVRAARALLLISGGLALVLSVIGLYAALAFAVTQRTREIAIRLALGATRSDVGTLVLRRGAAIVGVGLLAGIAAAAWLAGPVLASLLYGVSPRDPLSLLAGPVVLSAVALVAIWIPARRAMAMHPAMALRSE